MHPKATLFALLGAGLIVLAGMQATRQYFFLHSAKEAAGRVVDTPFGGSHPKIEFTVPDGRSIKYSQGGLIFGYRVGDAVQVFYYEADPDRSACLRAVGALWGASFLLLLVGLVFIAVAVF